MISIPNHIRKKSGSISTDNLIVKNFANTTILKRAPVKSNMRNNLELFTFSLKKDIVANVAMSVITIEKEIKNTFWGFLKLNTAWPDAPNKAKEKIASNPQLPM